MENFCKNKPFDNIISVTNRSNFFVLNGNSIICLKWTGEFLSEHMSPYPLTKIIHD